jgi:hypothetical protein
MNQQYKIPSLEYTYALLAKPKDYLGRIQGNILPNSITAVTNCINNRWLLYVLYQGDRENVGGPRWIECYVLGKNKYTGNLMVRCWQYKGKTTTDIPKWATFRLDRIRSTAVLTTKTFDKPRPFYNPDDLNMSEIVAAVTFPKK